MNAAPGSGATPRVTVVIPVKNGESVLPTQLEALARQQVVGGFEVVISDNGSRDGTVGVARSFEDRLVVRVVNSSDRPGPGGARNVGAAHARADLLLFLDADDRIHPGYVEAMAAALERSAMVGATSFPSLFDAPGDGREPEIVPGVRPGLMPWTSSSNLGMSRDLFTLLGGFAEELTFAGEDMDICWRGRLAGADLTGVPEAHLDYRLPATARDHFRKGLRYGQAYPQLARRYPRLVRARPRPAVLLRSQAALLLRLVRLRSPRDRNLAAYLLGRNLGRVVGSFRWRSLRRLRVVYSGGVDELEASGLTGGGNQELGGTELD